MRFATPLVRGRLIRRYMRFLADVRLEESGEVVKVHCPNPGAMTGLKTPGLPVWLERNDDPKKKLDWGWRLAELPGGHWAGIDTAVPNRVVAEALAARAIPELLPYERVRPEVRYGTNSRIDFLLEGPEGATWVEVKNVHLRREGDCAEFPDSVTARGAKHLVELAERARQGDQAVMLYLVQRSDCARFRLAGDIDRTYARAFDAARSAGVEMLCYGTRIDAGGVALGRRLPVDPAPQAPGLAIVDESS
ncbi:sugar fermentation stimulation protein A [Oceanicola granulosus HTCC2516]|uniref:Sugar fermentation stimulation protein homolog n=1 Tax=Oceanicola granulosus (strain ATCC BAA-861 / DSM 15982 / KCTC 12143 / HTCC2516) TaxID=314256 RepID=Q2CD39_OCEGH|nr:DNA/RNA nuclease SfsA [Oceanicola granulosus]EAR50639.1 sugar fermentation stimulation protein A [Oceanicola granulosus HTCC2516]